jgi:NitT/TauT family transport system substrate-binding protein
VNLVNLPPTQYVNAITNGTVDAIVSIQPTVGTIQSQLGTNAVTWSLQSEQPAYLTLVCRSDWATQHPDLVIRFLKSLSQAEDYLINHKEAAQAIVEKRLNQTISQDTWSNNQYTLSLDQSLILAMRDEAQWLISNNLTNATSVPNFLDYIYSNGLESVKPGAVNIIG